MTSVSFVTVDVFTKEKYSGNQLAIVQVPETGLTQEQKQNIAKEFNLSETTFVHPQTSSSGTNSWTVDIFTLDQELPFAGHPTIGTAVHLLQTLATHGSSKVAGSFRLKAGQVDLEYDATQQVARANIPHKVHVHRAICDSTEMLKLQPKLGRVPAQSPVVSIVKGMTFVLAELSSLDDLTFVNMTAHTLQMDLDDEKGASFIGSYFYVRSGNQLRTRMIESSVGEDAATGSAACTLACYLTIKEKVAGRTASFYITQGVEMGRRSEIGVHVTTTPDGKIEKVTLEGSAVQVMEGKLTL
jgi:PhzF family phenazine biosynthesis protein